MELDIHVPRFTWPGGAEAIASAGETTDDELLDRAAMESVTD